MLCVADVYRNPDTGRFRVDRESKRLWRFDTVEPINPDYWVASDEMLFAHNALFEYTIAKNTLSLPIEIHQLYCTQHLALFNGLPAKLDDISKAVPLQAPKDEAGHRLMIRMCKPQKNGEYLFDQEKFERLCAYCEQDIEAEAEVLETLMPFEEHELASYHETATINLNGIPVDMQLVAGAKELVAVETDRIQRAIPDINLRSPVAVKKFSLSHGFEMKSTDKDHVAKYLKDPKLPDAVRPILEAKAMGVGSSSVSKFDAMENYTDDDGNLRNAYRHHGAIRTGRWTSQGVQIQNLPRGEKYLLDLDTLKILRQAIKDRDIDKIYMMTGGRPMDAYKSVVRSCFAPPEDYTFVQRDLSAIEARGVLWVAGAQGLSVFTDFDKGIGDEPYMVFAKRLNPSNPDRFMGKQGCLSTGYGIGIQAFINLCDGYGKVISEEEARNCLSLYKEMFPEVPEFWKRVEGAAMAAMNKPFTVFEVETPTENIKFKYNGDTLRCMLPSGRALTYWGAKLEVGNFNKDQITYMSSGTDNGKAMGWHRTRTWGGSMTGHIVQGFSACIMRDILIRQRASGIPACMTTHDESVSMMLKAEAQDAFDRLGVLMKTPPAWAQGLPIQSAGWINDFFLKD
jgi:DNA polymerase